MNLNEMSAKVASQEAQKAFAGLAEELRNPTEDEVLSWVYEVRYGKADPFTQPLTSSRMLYQSADSLQ